MPTRARAIALCRLYPLMPMFTISIYTAPLLIVHFPRHNQRLSTNNAAGAQSTQTCATGHFLRTSSFHSIRTPCTPAPHGILEPSYWRIPYSATRAARGAAWLRALCSRAGQPLEPDLDHASGGKRQNPKTLPQTALLTVKRFLYFAGKRGCACPADSFSSTCNMWKRNENDRRA